MRAGTTLIVYSLLQHPLRAAVKDHLDSFRRFGDDRYVYLNLHARTVPGWIRDMDFDTVIFHTTFLSQRWRAPVFEGLVAKARPLLGKGRARMALPQDEFLCSSMLSEFIEEFELDHVFSVAPPSEWPKIYAGVDRERVRFTQALTGYLSDATLGRIERILRQTRERPTGIGYRAWESAPWLGRHGMVKRRVGEEFERAARERGIPADISMRPEDTLSGDDWFRFLARCRYAVGVEGGASILDPEGAIRERTETYLAAHPGAGFDEVEAACFPGQDGKLALFAISPRHLEACATRTCQVLVEGDYSGVLEPGEHYIEVKRDLSNVAEVMDLIERDSERERIAEAAHRHVVASGRYSYASFVAEVEAAAAEAREGRGAARPAASLGPIRGAWAEAADRASWLRVIVVVKLLPPLSRALSRFLPDGLLARLRRRVYATDEAPADPPRASR